jgi:crotonobetainyl-CoA:carnitine CoA-transferase CaiB-like acyl-CoA transferase
MLARAAAASRGITVTLKRPDGTVVDTVKSPLVGKAGADALAPPALGEHSDALLGELLGIDAAEAARLRKAGVTG